MFLRCKRGSSVSFKYSYNQGQPQEYPCLNGGSCIHDLIAVCVCPENFDGPLCEHPTGKLVIHASHASTVHRINWLPREDQTADPYLLIKAYGDNGRHLVRKTHLVRNTLDPVWNETIEFGSQVWNWFTIQLLDDNREISTGPGTLSAKYRYNLTSFTPTVKETVGVYEPRGHFSFYYTYSNDLDPEYEYPCQNGGSCVQIHSLMEICSCPQNFSGPFCEYPAGKLIVYVSHGQNLPNRDGLNVDGTSDPFVVIIAHGRDGEKKRLSTRTIRDNLNPVWNEIIEFESMALSWFTIEVWDDDSDGPWLNSPLSPVHRYNVTHFTQTVEESFEGTKRGSSVSFKYSYNQGQPQECPCLNGGSCIHNLIAVCVCPENFDGPLCEYPVGKLVVYVSHGQNLYNADLAAYGTSDPLWT